MEYFLLILAGIALIVQTYSVYTQYKGGNNARLAGVSVMLITAVCSIIVTVCVALFFILFVV